MIPEIKFKNLNKVNFGSKKLRKEFAIVKKRGEQLIESTKIDVASLNNSFDF